MQRLRALAKTRSWHQVTVTERMPISVMFGWGHGNDQPFGNHNSEEKRGGDARPFHLRLSFAQAAAPVVRGERISPAQPLNVSLRAATGKI
jgi:hypothetical protein